MPGAYLLSAFASRRSAVLAQLAIGERENERWFFGIVGVSAALGFLIGRVVFGWVEVTLEVGDGLPHVYQLLLGTPEAAEATERIGKFLRARAP